MFIFQYQPKPIANICDSGNALLYSGSATCGDAIPRKLGKGVLSKVIVQDGRLIVAITGEADNGVTLKDNLIILKSRATGNTGKITEKSWKEKF